MNSIKIKIIELGKLRNSQITVSPLMVFSGESGLGKSYLAILCHYFFELMVNANRLNHFFADNNIDFNTALKKDTGIALALKKQDIEKWMAQDAIHYLGYMLGHEGIEGKIEIALPNSFPDVLSYSYKKELIGLVNEEDIYTILSLGNLSYRIQENTQFDESPFSILLRLVMIDFILGDYRKLRGTFVLPPSRGPVLTEQMKPNTGMYTEFVNDMTELNRIKPRPDTASPMTLKLFQAILDGDVTKDEATYIYTTSGTSMPISAAAASIREIAPLQILAQKEDISKVSILLEEPEAHLHPIKQRMMADIIGTLCHNGAIMQITTHSDYFIRRLNELILFDKIHSKANNTTGLSHISNKTGIVYEMTISESTLNAYLLEVQPDGTSRAVKQDLSNGIPFSSFRDAIMSNMSNQDFLEMALQNGTE